MVVDVDELSVSVHGCLKLLTRSLCFRLRRVMLLILSPKVRNFLLDFLGSKGEFSSSFCRSSIVVCRRSIKMIL